ncbi:MAG TPA: Ig-like domain-containing protein [Acidobacteriaceae bacterium]
MSHFKALRISSAQVFGSIFIAICIVAVGRSSAQTLRSIGVSPSSAQIPIAFNQQFAATGVYSDGSTRDLTTTVTWSTSDGTIATISRSGVATGKSAGIATISATTSGIKGSASLTIRNARLTSIILSPTAPSVVVKNAIQFTATGLYSDGSSSDLTSLVTWSSSSKSIATINGSGFATTAKAGTTTISAAFAGAPTVSTSLTVIPITLQSIAVTPLNSSALTGTTVQYTAIGSYSDGSTANITTSVTWSSSQTTVATIRSSGLASAVGQGIATIKATSSGVSGSTSLTVTASLSSISISPSSASLALGLAQQFKATAHYSDGTTSDVTTLASWTSSVVAVATVSNNAGVQGLATSLATGTTSIAASYQGHTSVPATLTVNSAALVSIAVSPLSASIALGTSQQFIATGTYTDGSTKAITTSVSWVSSTPTVATIGVSGTAVSRTVGTTTITSSSGSISGSATLFVSPAALVSISVTPLSLSLPKGVSQQFTAAGIYTDGSTQNITSSVQWTSSDPSVVSISSNGSAEGIATGAAQIIASASGTGISGQSTVTVGPAALVSIAVAPTNAAIALGTIQQFAAVGTYTDGSTQDLTGSILWSTSDTGIATISSTGQAMGHAAGSTTITATSGTIAGSTTLMVNAAALVSIAITPAIPSVPLGETQQFTATGTFADGTIQDLTNTVNWSSSDSTVATIGMTSPTRGVAQTLATGTTTISASSAGVSGTTVLTVIPAVMIAIEVTPSPLSLAIGSTRQLSAIATYSDETTKDISSAATWTSSDGAIATVSANGIVTAVASGSSTVSAASGGITGSTNVQVSPAVLVSIAVSPGSASIPLGTTQRFTAIGSYSDASTQDLTTAVQWTSSDATVATISMTQSTAGLATSTATGSATITATSGSVSGTADLTVTPAVLISIAITPVAPSIALGQSQGFIATGTYSDQSTKDITTNVTWSTSNAPVAIISNTIGSNGLATSAGQGTATIEATMGSVAAATTLTVTALAAPTGLTATAGMGQIALNWNSVNGATNYQISRGITSGGPYAVLAVASTNSYTDTGLAGNSTYYYVVSAANSVTQSNVSVEASATTLSTTPTLVSLSISPLNPSIVAGATQQFAATALYSDSTMTDVTSSAIWSSSNAAVATISTTGLASTVAQGNTTIGATYGGLSASTTLVAVAGGKITLGQAANDGGSTQINCGYQGVCMVPIYMYGNASGYRLSNISFNVHTVSGTVLLGVYGATTGTNCPIGFSYCAGSLLCSTPSQITDVIGNNVIAATSFTTCPTFTMNSIYFLAIETSGGGVQLSGESGSFCPGTGYFALSKTGLSSMAMPSTMGSGQTEPSADNCPQLSATFTCVASCGTAPTPWTMFSYAGNTNGAAVTTTNLLTGAYCTAGTIGGSLTRSTTYSTSGVQGFASSPLCNATAESSGTVSIKRSLADSWTYSYGGGSTQSDMVFWINDSGNTTSSGSNTDIGEIDGGNTITLQIIKNASCPAPSIPCFAVERSGHTTSVSGAVPFSQNTWYAVAILNVSGGTHQVAVYDTTGTQIATTSNACADGKTICIPSDASGNPSEIRLMNCGSYDSAVGTLYYGPVLLDPTGQSFASIGTSYVAMRFPDSPERIGPELSKLVHDGVIPHAEIKDGHWYSYALNRYLL